MKTKTGSRSISILAQFAVVLLTAAVGRAQISFAPPVTISGDSDVDTTGTAVGAYSFDTGTTVNGVTFTASASFTALGTNFTMGNVAFAHHGAATFAGGAGSPYTGLSSAYKNVIQGGDYVGTQKTVTITIINLSPGHQYRVQVWENDSRTGRSTSYQTTVTGSNSVAIQMNSTGALGGVGQYTIGTFTAVTTTQTFTLLGNYSDTYLNAIQLRDSTPFNSAPFIIIQPPASATNTAGSTNVFSVTATGNAPLTYAWYFNSSSNYSGATPETDGGRVSGSATASLTITNLQAGDSGYYFVVLTNSLGSLTSQLSQLTIFTAPVIIGSSPVTYTNLSTLFSGTSPTFSVLASGSAPLEYLWFTNGVPDGTGTNPAYQLHNLPVGVISNYCVVTNTLGSVTSFVWTASVITAPVAPYPQAVLAGNPLGYWRLNESNIDNYNNGAIADDYWGGNNGIYTNTILGQVGYNSNTDPSTTSAEFGIDSSTDNDAYGIAGVNFGSPTNTSGSFSVEAWVNGYTQTKDAGIVSLGYGGGGEQFDLDTGSDTAPTSHGFRFLLRDAAGNPHSAASTIVPSSGNWHHLVGVCDEVHSNLTLYVDGLVAGTAAISPGSGILASTRLMLIGSRPSNSTNIANDLQFVGNVNEVAVYNYALSASQVITQYTQAGVPPSFAQAPPASVSTDAGATIVIPVAAIGTQSLGYTWADMGGGTNLTTGLTNANLLNANLTVSNVPASWNGDTLQLTVSNAYGTTNISVALNVISGLGASVMPTSVALSPGQSFTYTAQASGTVPIYYQWYAGSLGTPILNATNASYTAVAVLGDSTFICQVSNGSGSTNLPVTLTGLSYLTLNWTGAGWAEGQSGTFTNTPAAFTNGVLTLTDGSASVTRSAFFGVPQYIGAFEASFTYQAGGNKTADGAAFVVQNDPRGSAALGGGGGDLAVSGITPSAEVEFNLYTGASQVRGYTFLTNGLTGLSGANGNYKAPGSVNLASGDPINIALYYSQGTLSLTLTDAVAVTSFSTNLNIGSLPGIVGTNTAYVGFTGASGGSTAVQTITGFTFISLMNLTTQVSSTNLVLAWPSGASIYQLQSNTNLATATWVNVPNSVTVTNSQSQVTVPLSGGAEFYRLQLQ